MRRLSSGNVSVDVDTGIGFGAKVAVAVENAKATGGGVKVGKGVIISVEGGTVIVGVSVAGGVCPQAARRAKEIIKIYRDFIVIGNLLC